MKQTQRLPVKYSNSTLLIEMEVQDYHFETNKKMFKNFSKLHAVYRYYKNKFNTN